MTTDFYKRLGVPRNATQDQIKRAYKALALKWHPDKNQNNREEATEVFRTLSEAYECLSDPQSRQFYDQHGHAPGDGPTFHRTATSPGAGTRADRIFASPPSPFHSEDFDHFFFTADHAFRVFEEVFCGRDIFSIFGDNDDFPLGPHFDLVRSTPAGFGRRRRRNDFFGLHNDLMMQHSTSFDRAFDDIFRRNASLPTTAFHHSASMTLNGSSPGSTSTHETVFYDSNGQYVRRVETRTVQPDGSVSRQEWSSTTPPDSRQQRRQQQPPPLTRTTQRDLTRSIANERPSLKQSPLFQYSRRL